MARRRDETPRVLGPYWSKTKGRWFAKVLIEKGDRGGRRSNDRWFGEDREVAEHWVNDAREKLVRLQGGTVAGALADYKTFLFETGHKRPSSQWSADELERRMKLFFEGALTHRLSGLTEEKGTALYRAFAARTYLVGPKDKRREKPISVYYHRHTLSLAKSFLGWCVKPAKLLEANPFAEIRGVGVQNVGKEQLTGNESIAFYEWCAYKAHRGDDAALALVMLLLMALRQGDARRRVVRDVDLGGTVLRIGVGSSARSKSKKGDRPRKIPVVLQPLVNKAIEGRSPLEPLFPAADGGFHTKSWLLAAARRFCKQAGVPYVCPHGLKGTAGTLATDAGALADQVAEYLSHESKKTSEQHYIAGGAVAEATAAAGLKVITGGRR